jgi:hypothetical protein
MEEGMRMSRCFVPLETARRVPDVRRDELLRFNLENLDDGDENEGQNDVEEMEEEKETVRMSVQEIRRAIGAEKWFSFTMSFFVPVFCEFRLDLQSD